MTKAVLKQRLELLLLANGLEPLERLGVRRNGLGRVRTAWSASGRAGSAPGRLGERRYGL